LRRSGAVTTIEHGMTRGLALGFLAGSVIWAAASVALDALPPAIRFAFACPVFVLGPGGALTVALTRDRSALDRAAIALGAGVAAAPALAHVLLRVGLDAAFPYVAAGCTGAVIVYWIGRPAVEPTGRATWIRAAAVAALAVATGAAGYAGRLDATPSRVTVYGEYDTFDSTYYAAISTEVARRIPPDAPFNAGHELNYSYFPHLLLGLLHRFASVPLLDLYFGLAWTALLALLAITAFVLVRAIASERAAVVGTVLLLAGSDLSFIVPLVADTARLTWDPVIWSSNFLSPGAETLLFNTWTPSLVVVLSGFYALACADRGGSRGWLLLASALFATLVQFKTFAYAAIVGGLAAAALVAGVDRARRTRYALTLGLTLLLSSPYLAEVASGYEESQASLVFEPFVLPSRMMDKLTLDRTMARWTAAIGATGMSAQVLTMSVATALFLAGGLGARWAGVPALWRTLRLRDGGPPVWAAIGWTIVAGAAIPFAVATDPYYGTAHFHQTALFLLWLFAGRALANVSGAGRRAAAIAVVVALAVPSTAHYLARKTGDRARPLARLDAGALSIARYLRGLDPAVTVVLHRDPDGPSLLGILGEQPVVLAWARYVRGSDDRRRDVRQFFASADGDAAQALGTLARYNVTHVVTFTDSDHVHPDVLTHLQPVIRTTHATLYAVPPRHAEPGGAE
jgi:hypothetical protein